MPGPKVDDEFEKVSQSFTGLVDGLKDIRRSDGKLKNGTVPPDQLSPALNIGFTMRGVWDEETAYSGGDGVYFDNALYGAHDPYRAGPPDAPP